MEEENWAVEMITPYEKRMFKVDRTIYRNRSKYQLIEIHETPGYGKVLMLDYKVQSSEKDEWIYHESLVHPALVTHPSPKDILVIGGGEGATAREALKHSTVRSLTMVDIDEDVIKVCKEYIPEMNAGVFEDRRFKLVIADGREYLLKSNSSSFDVIIIDATDPIKEGPSIMLYSKSYYEQCHRVLRDDGIVVTQSTSPYHDKHVSVSIFKTMLTIFPIVRMYMTFVPSYASCWSFVIGSKRYDPLELSEQEIAKRLKDRGVTDLRSYSPSYHFGMFSLPLWLELAIKDPSIGKIITDDSPVYVSA